MSIGLGKCAWEHCWEKQKNGQRPISLAKLRSLQAEVLKEDRLKRIA